MSLMGKMVGWRNPDNYDEPPTDEQAMRQFVYVAISDFIEENQGILGEWLTFSDDPEVPGLNEWLDLYAERDPLVEVA